MAVGTTANAPPLPHYTPSRNGAMQSRNGGGLSSALEPTMFWEDGTDDSSLGAIASDSSRDSGVDSMVSTASAVSTSSRMATDFSALHEETLVMCDFDENVALGKSQADLSDEELRAEQRLQSTKTILKASRSVRRSVALRDITNKKNTIDDDGTPKTSKVGAMLQWAARKRSSRISFSQEPEEHCKRQCDGKSLHYATNENHPVRLLRVHSTSEVETRASPPLAFGSPNSTPECPYTLPAVENPQKDSTAFRSISGATLMEQLSTLSDEQFFERYILVDCRYPYEFAGGHIKHAINIHNPEELSGHFFPKSEEDFKKINVRTPIFYCEYSQKRGPQMAMALRKLDRQRNAASYPNLDYPALYLLDRGYRRFWEGGFTAYCEPQSYKPMDHTDHQDDLKKFHLHKKSKSFSVFGRSETSRVTMRSRLLAPRNNNTSMQQGTRSENDMLPPMPVLPEQFAHLRIDSPPCASPSVSRRQLFPAGGAAPQMTPKTQHVRKRLDFS